MRFPYWMQLILGSGSNTNDPLLHYTKSLLHCSWSCPMLPLPLFYSLAFMTYLLHYLMLKIFQNTNSHPRLQKPRSSSQIHLPVPLLELISASDWPILFPHLSIQNWLSLCPDHSHRLFQPRFHLFLFLLWCVYDFPALIWSSPRKNGDPKICC